MHFLHSVYYRASYGCPDALPKGIIAVDLEDTVDLTADAQEVGRSLSCQGFFDDRCWKVGCELDDADLVVNVTPHEKYGEIGGYITSDQIVPTWMFEQIKNQPNVVVFEQSIRDDECEGLLEECDC